MLCLLIKQCVSKMRYIPEIGGALGVGKIHNGLVSITDFALMFLNGCIVTVVVATI